MPTIPDLNADGTISVPEEPRRDCEGALTLVADLLAVFLGGSRSVSSANPGAAFVAETDAEQALLDGSSGVRIGRHAKTNLRYKIGLTTERIQALTDRLDGVALMAEALSHGSAGGKYRDFIRLFELAFAKKASQLPKKLSQFLAAADLGYTRDEIEQWIEQRHPSSHADLKIEDYFALSWDVAPFVARMEQAARDVLFNKAEWHAFSRNRRALLTPSAGTSSGDQRVFFMAKDRGDVQLEAQLKDEFDVFPLNLSVTFRTLPDGWWWKPVEPHERERLATESGGN